MRHQNLNIIPDTETCSIYYIVTLPYMEGINLNIYKITIYLYKWPIMGHAMDYETPKSNCRKCKTKSKPCTKCSYQTVFRVWWISVQKLTTIE